MPLISKTTAKTMGIPRKTLQTIEIPADFGLKKARQWLNEHHYASAYYRRTKNMYRFMQTPDINGASYYSKKLPSGFVLVFQEY